MTVQELKGWRQNDDLYKTELQKSTKQLLDKERKRQHTLRTTMTHVEK